MSAIAIVVGTATGALCLIFGVVFLFARKIDNYGLVDIAWSYAFALLAGSYALLLDGWWVRRALVAGMVGLWSIRLGTHLLVRVAHHHPREDTRYRQLRVDWAKQFNLKMAGFFQLQALSVVLLGTPFLLSALNPAPHLSKFEIAALALWLLALAGESAADRQLSRFKTDPANQGQVCRVGWWAVSRHPNYFFEWLIWVAYFLFALPSPWGFVSGVSPLCILWLLLRVTGIPLSEQQSLLSKGALYRQYQKSTSAFVPWVRRQRI